MVLGIVSGSGGALLLVVYKLLVVLVVLLPNSSGVCRMNGLVHVLSMALVVFRCAVLFVDIVQ